MGPYLAAIRAHPIVVLLTVVAALAGGVAFLATRSDTYEATARLLITAVPQTDAAFLGMPVLRDTNDPTRTAQTAASVVQSRDAARRTARALGEDWDADRVLGAVSVEPLGESSILGVTAMADDPAEAARIANTFARQALSFRGEQLQERITTELARLREQIRTGTGAPGNAAIGDDGGNNALRTELVVRLTQLEAVQGTGDPTLTLTEEAIAPSAATEAGDATVLALALIAGLVLGSGAAVALQLFDRRVRGEEEASSLLPLPVLARIPLLGRRHRPDKTEWWQMEPGVREAYGTLVAQLEADPKPNRTLMITSPTAGDGKTTSALNLAVALANAGQSVILMDFDLRKPDLAALVDVPPQAFTPDSGDVPLADALVAFRQIPTLWLLPTGAVADERNLADALNRRVPELLAEARSLADYVIVDTPPLGEVGDALRIVSEVDDVLVLSRLGNTSRTGLDAVRELLGRAGREPLGLIVIGRPRGGSDYYYGRLSPGANGESEEWRTEARSPAT